MLNQTPIDREFEKFRGGPTENYAERLHVTINKEYIIGINEKCFRMLGKPPAVYLYYSRARDVILVEPVSSERLPEAFPVKVKNSTGYRINASPFCKHFGIRPDATLRFIKPNIEGGRLILKLGDVVITRQHRRKKNIDR
jgi:hypothetical protein